MHRQALVSAVITCLAIFSFLSIGVLFSKVPNVKATTTNFSLYAFIQGWSYSNSLPPPAQANPTITVTQGDTISFTLIDGAGDYYSPHVFLLDLDNTTTTNDCPNPGPDKCSGYITPTQTGSIPSFTVNVATGHYMYYCTIHPTAMLGKFVVVAPTPDFTVSANPMAIGPINTRVAGTSTITVAPTNGFSGSVTLSASPSSGLNASLSRTSFPTSSGTATLSVNSTRAGSYSVTISGTGSPGTHSTTVSVTVVIPDFSIALSSSTLSVASGSSGSVTVTLTSLNGFSGTVTLTSALSSPGPQIAFSPASLTVSSSGPVTSTLSASSASSGAYSTPVPVGTYTANVTATSDSLVHSTILTLTVGSSSAAGALPTTIIIGGIVAAIAVVAGIVYVLRRKPKSTT